MQIQDNAFELVLFDLDGTLVDTAPDMVATLQQMQSDYGYDPIAYDLGRSNVSNGAMGLLRVGFPDIDVEGRQVLVGEYIERYAERLCDLSEVFDGLHGLLDFLDDETQCNDKQERQHKQVIGVEVDRFVQNA